MDVAGLSDEHGARYTVAPGARSGVDHLAAAAETADRRQAAYFLRLLSRSRRLADYRIGKYRRAVAAAEANGNVGRAADFRRLLRIEERDRQVVDGLIENLHRRFSFPIPGQVRSLPGKAPLPAPQGRNGVMR
jgi:hypothetical protein